MSEYFSHLFYFVFKLFKKDQRSSSLPNIPTPERSNSLLEKPGLPIANNKEFSHCDSSDSPTLKRYKSCPLIDEDEIIATETVTRCRTCSEKRSIFTTVQNYKDLEQYRESQNILNIGDPARCPLESDDFTKESTNKTHDFVLERRHSLNLGPKNKTMTSFNEESLLRKSYPPASVFMCGDGEHITSKNEKDYYNLLFKRSIDFKFDGDKINLYRTSEPNELLLIKPENDSFHPDTELKTTNLNGTTLDRDTFFNESRYFDTSSSTSLQQSLIESKKEELIYENSPSEAIPEYELFQPLLTFKTNDEDEHSFSEKFRDDLRNFQISTDSEERRHTCKSRIPVHQSKRRFSCGSKSNCIGQSLGRRFFKTSFLYLTRKHFSGRGRKCRSRNTTISTTDRSLLNAKLDRMFKEFTKKIYRGNIIDHCDHIRWLKKAGITEDEDASSFKSYAKCKVVLTLPEYKEALLKMSEDYNLDYWDVLRKMTDVNNKGDADLLQSGIAEYQIESRDERTTITNKNVLEEKNLS